MTADVLRCQSRVRMSGDDHGRLCLAAGAGTWPRMSGGDPDVRPWPQVTETPGYTRAS